MWEKYKMYFCVFTAKMVTGTRYAVTYIACLFYVIKVKNVFSDRELTVSRLFTDRELTVSRP
jgi:hypothetical protein